MSSSYKIEYCVRKFLFRECDKNFAALLEHLRLTAPREAFTRKEKFFRDKKQIDRTVHFSIQSLFVQEPRYMNNELILPSKIPVW